MDIQAKGLDYRALNEAIRAAGPSCRITGCLGQRFIGAGLGQDRLTITGTPGNALGAYLDGACIEVNGDAQDAVGDTMNAGRIIVHGSIGDAAGYAMRGGELYIEGNAGYRAGIHMKAYQQHFPVMVVGGKAGSFLGEYLAGGLILVLGIGQNGAYPVNNFCGTGMHGGKIVLRCDKAPTDLPRQVLVSEVSADDMTEFAPYIKEYAQLFGADAENLLSQKYFVLTPNPEAGYKQLYTFEA